MVNVVSGICVGTVVLWWLLALVHCTLSVLKGRSP
jgi:hypothetical protein